MSMKSARDRLNCPNCGAPITSYKCEYCGTLFYDFANLELYEPSYIRLRIGDTLNIFRAVTTSIEVTQSSPEVCYADNKPFLCGNPDITVTVEMRVVSDDKGVLMERRRNV
ncbi:MAG: hypothetical protein K6F88_03385 [Ruminococcus sp.]|nr:hypothetical protein [Ruminococcus sp.]